LAICTHLCQDGVHFPEDVNDLYGLLRQLSQHESVEEALYEKLWRGAVAEQPDEETQLEWCEDWASQAIRHQHWTQLIKASMFLKKATRQGSDEWRKYSFWLIVAQWLAGRPRDTNETLSTSDEKLRVLNETLAIRQLQEALKTAEAPPQGVSYASMIC